MNLLRVDIAEHWPEQTPVRWALFAVDGGRETLLRAGQGSLQTAPEADVCELVLAGAQCTLHRLRLPPGQARDQHRLIGYALEERLAQEPETLHYTLLGKLGEDSLVAVVAQSRLQAVLAACAQAGRTVQAVWPALAGLPAEPDCWVGTAGAQGGLLRLGNGEGLAWDLPVDGQLPWPFAQALREAEAQGRRPSGIQLQLDEAAPALPLADWSAALGIAITAVPAGAAAAWPRAANLLHGPFAPRRAARTGGLAWPALRPAAWLAGAALALQLGLGLLQTVWLQWQVKAQQQAQEALFQSAFPGAAMVDPALQTRRLLNDLKARQGQLRDDDFLALTMALADALGGQAAGTLRAMQYDNGQLKVTLQLPATMEASVLQQSLAARGVAARLPDAVLPAKAGSEVQLLLQRSLP